MKLLAIRLSALGDIAMTIPVLESLCVARPDVDVTLLSTPMAQSICATLGVHFRVKAVNVKRDYAGVAGLNKLYDELRDEGYDAVADLHNVLRTRWLRARFHLALVPTAKIHKGRREKRALVHHSRVAQLESGIERYHDVLTELGFQFDICYHSPIARTCSDSICVGIAPFAQHRGKTYPLTLMERVVDLLLDLDSRVRIYLFGGKADAAQLKLWAAKDDHIVNMAGVQSIGDDVRLMARMDCIVSMDSANMHLASLVGTPVVSVWGATHPYAGFLGFGQNPQNIIQLPLDCRPCSIYGKKPCRYGDYHCMTDIRPETIVERVKSLLPLC